MSRQNPNQYDDTARPQQRVNLTPEEIATLRECGRESFWFRSLPLGTVLMATTSIAMRRGMISPSAGFFKTFSAGMFGYVLGKLSYTGQCREKIMQLPNSPLAEAMRQGKAGAYGEVLEMNIPSLGGTSYDGTQASDADSRPSADFRSRMDLDTEKNVQSEGLDDSNRPTMDSMREGSRPTNQEEEQSQRVTTYEELRRRNRDEATRQASQQPPSPQQRYAPPRPPPPSGSYLPPGGRPERPVRSDNEPPQAPIGRTKGKYGDVGFD